MKRAFKFVLVLLVIGGLFYGSERAYTITQSTKNAAAIKRDEESQAVNARLIAQVDVLTRKLVDIRKKLIEQYPSQEAKFNELFGVAESASKGEKEKVADEQPRNPS